jgi:hypothetical protein
VVTGKGATVGGYAVERIDEVEAIFHGSFGRAADPTAAA